MLIPMDGSLYRDSPCFLIVIFVASSESIAACGGKDVSQHCNCEKELKSELCPNVEGFLGSRKIPHTSVYIKVSRSVGGGKFEALLLVDELTPNERQYVVKFDPQANYRLEQDFDDVTPKAIRDRARP